LFFLQNILLHPFPLSQSSFLFGYGAIGKAFAELLFHLFLTVINQNKHQI